MILLGNKVTADIISQDEVIHGWVGLKVNLSVFLKECHGERGSHISSTSCDGRGGKWHDASTGQRTLPGSRDYG